WHRLLQPNPLRLLDCKVPGCRTVIERAPVMRDSLCTACSAHFDEVRALLDQERVPYALNLRLVRGLDYYCRTAFEIVAEGEGLGAQNAIGGGGRYDGLVAMLGGPDVPGVGFALGLDRLAMAAPASVEAEAGPAALILPLEPRAVAPALPRATRLAGEGRVRRAQARRRRPGGDAVRLGARPARSRRRALRRPPRPDRSRAGGVQPGREPRRARARPRRAARVRDRRPRDGPAPTGRDRQP